MMSCKECGGRVTIDRAYSTSRRFELACIRCGKDWVLTNVSNRFFQWLYKQEFGLESKANGY
jgi:DNA-directed RNA polymerase subunit RPC12/RpoP